MQSAADLVAHAKANLDQFIWVQIPGPEEHPESQSFQGRLEDGTVMIILGVDDAAQPSYGAIGGSLIKGSLLVVNIPLKFAWAALKKAKEKIR